MLIGKCGNFCQASVHHLTGVEVFCTEVSIEVFGGFLGIRLLYPWSGHERREAPAEGPPQVGHTSGLKHVTVRKWLFLLGFPLVWTINLSVWYLFWLFKYLLICLFLLAHAHVLVNMCQKKPFFVAWNRASRAGKCIQLTNRLIGLIGSSKPKLYKTNTSGWFCAFWGSFNCTVATEEDVALFDFFIFL